MHSFFKILCVFGAHHESLNEVGGKDVVQFLEIYGLYGYLQVILWRGGVKGQCGNRKGQFSMLSDAISSES